MLFAVVLTSICWVGIGYDGSCPLEPSRSVRQEARCASPTAPANGRVAVAFFGISRRLNSALPFIERHVFDVLDRANITYDVFWHTVSTPSVQNSHAHEQGIAVNEYDAMLMRPCRVTLVDQDVFSAQEFDRYCRTKNWKCSKSKNFDRDTTNSEKYNAGLWSNSFEDMRNRLNSLASQREVLAMIREHAVQHDIQYDGIAALRPDMAPITDIDLPHHLPDMRDPAFADHVWVPDYQPFRGYHDRYGWCRGCVC